MAQSQTTQAPATGTDVLAALRAATGDLVVAKAEASLRQMAPKLGAIAAAREGAAQEAAALGGLTQDQCEKLVMGEKRLGQLAQSWADRRSAHRATTKEEAAELDELRAALQQAHDLGLVAGHPAVKAAEGRISALEAAKANRVAEIRGVLGKAYGVIRGLRSLPISGGWKPAEGPVSDLVAAVQAAAKEAYRAAGKEKAGARKGTFSSGPAPAEGALAAQLKGVKIPDAEAA